MSFFGAGAGGAGVGSSGFFGKSARVVPGDQFGEVEKDPLPSDDHTWEIEEGHSNRVKAQFQWDEANEDGADTGVEFTGGRKELLALDSGRQELKVDSNVWTATELQRRSGG